MDSKFMTYKDAPRHLLTFILERGTPATRPELEVLFLRHVIGHELENNVQRVFRDIELKKAIAIKLYKINVVDLGKDRRCVMQQITEALGVHGKTMEGWERKFFTKNE